MPGVIQVTGQGSATVLPDVLQASLAAEAIGADVATALTSAGDSLAAMAAAARAAGLTDGDLCSTDMSVQNNYDNQGRPSGFRAWLGLAVILHDLASAGGVLAHVVAAGGDAARVQSVGLAVSDPAAATDAARAAAFSDARHQAEQLAGLAGRAVGEVREIVHAPSYGGGGRQSGDVMVVATRASMPVEPGTGSVTATVEVRFTLV